MDTSCEAMLADPRLVNAGGPHALGVSVQQLRPEGVDARHVLRRTPRRAQALGEGRIVGHRAGEIEPAALGCNPPHRCHRHPAYPLRSGDLAIGFAQTQALNNLTNLTSYISNCLLAIASPPGKNPEGNAIKEARDREPLHPVWRHYGAN